MFRLSRSHLLLSTQFLVHCTVDTVPVDVLWYSTVRTGYRCTGTATGGVVVSHLLTRGITGTRGARAHDDRDPNDDRRRRSTDPSTGSGG